MGLFAAIIPPGTLIGCASRRRRCLKASRPADWLRGRSAMGWGRALVWGAAAAGSSMRRMCAQAGDWHSAKAIYDFHARDIDGNDVSLEKYRGYVCIITNVASK
uniref:Glutathione peroxidase 4 n=1 Tax=Calidris pygmaea TaxID=425635 RepID=A0A8C3J5X8_9CHAR